QAVSSVFPLLEREFALSKQQQGMIASSFMIVYAASGPFAGFLVDRMSRRALIAGGLGFWSLIAAGTGLSRSFGALLTFRAAEGLGESCYFPASMSILADYHGPRTRSRAMSLHQTSVYVGIAGGGTLAGYLAERGGWRMPFFVLGIVGFVYALILSRLIVEPARGAGDNKTIDPELTPPVVGFGENLGAILATPPAVALMLAFAAANFVTMALVTWLPSFVHERFAMGLLRDNATATLFMQGGSLVGVLIGGAVADLAARRGRGGRMIVQGAGLIAGAPCVLLVGHATAIGPLVAGLVAIGLAKGVYEANIFASIFDVIDPRLRGTAAGLMNTIGWAGASLAPVVVGAIGDRHGLGAAIASTAAVYLVAGLIALVASWLASRPRASW
ncbi:MAG TPA: MFS transporter, partial [Isosphaeraceae bacterium]